MNKANYQNNPLLFAALTCAEWGWSVLPLHTLTNGHCTCGNRACKSPGKHPVTKNGLKDATKDAQRIVKWWQQNPRWNVGIATGSVSGGLVVIDFDERHGGLNARQTLALPDTMRVTTGNGEHYYFYSATPIRNSANKLAPGVDVRGEGGYVVGPPSLHHSGRKYESVDGTMPVELPDAIVARLTASPVTTTAAAGKTMSLNNADDDLIVRDETLLAATVIEGQASRHDFLVSMAGRLHNAGLTGLELELALKGINQQRCQPPKSDNEVSKIAQWVSLKPSTNPIPSSINDQTSWPQVSTDGDVLNVGKVSGLNTPDFGLQVTTAADILLTVHEPQVPILTGLYKKQWGIVAAVSNLGKTTIMLNLCIALAAGRPFEPFTPDVRQPRKILYLDYENRAEDLQWNLAKMFGVLTPAEQQLVEENLQFIVQPELAGKPLLLTETDHLQRVAKFLRKGQFDLCIVDTLSQAVWLQDENSNSEVQRKVVTPFRRMAQWANCAIIGIHHEGKGGGQFDGEHTDQFRTRGASSLVSGARWQLTMRPTKPGVKGRAEFKTTKEKSDQERQWFTMEIDKPTRWFMPLVIAPPPKDLRTLVLESIEGSATAVTVDDLCAWLPAHKRDAIKQTLTRLHKEGLLMRGKRGEYRAAGGGTAGETEP